MSNRVKPKTEEKKIYKSLRYRLRVDETRNPPQKSLFRRFFGRLFRLMLNPVTISLFLLLLLGSGLALAYFWSDYSERSIGNWITYDTPVSNITAFCERVYINKDYRASGL